MAMSDFLTMMVSGVSVVVTALLMLLLYQIYVSYTFRPDLRPTR